MKILYLYSELAAYNIPVFKTLTNKYNALLHVVSWDKKKLKPYEAPEIENVHYYQRSEFSSDSLLTLAKNIKPDIIYVSGWMDKGYFKTLRFFKNNNIPIVIGFDDQWVGSIRQRLGIVLFRVYYQRYYTHAWVAGPRQFEFAKRLGFNNENIIFDLLTADVDLFKKSINSISEKADIFPKVFLYVGNFRKIKGTDILIEGFKKYRDKYKGDWKLICIGNGELEHLLKSEENVSVVNFQEQKELIKFVNKAGVFILPSRHDQWGVVVHEFCAAGMPMLLSEQVGAKTLFMIEGFNGLSFSNNSSDELARVMDIFTSKTDEELLNMSYNSIALSERVSPETSAANLISILSRAD